MIQFAVGVLVGWLLAWAFEVWFWRVRRRETGSPKIYLAESMRLTKRGPGVKAGYIGADVLRAPIESTTNEVSTRAAVHLPEPESEPEPVPPQSGPRLDALRLSEVMRSPRPEPVVAGSSARAYEVPALRLAESTPDPKPSPHPGLSPALLETIVPEDDFTRINGIGPVYQKRLKLANVRSFRDLACTHPATILAIIQPRHPNMVQVHQWVAEARALARAE